MRFQLTTQGQRLQALLQAGSRLILTRAEGGSTDSPEPETLTQVLDRKQTLQMNGVEYDAGSGRAKLSMTLSNMGLSEGYDLKQIGIYAKTEDTEEILYIIGQDSRGEEVPAITEKEVEFDYYLWFAFDNTYEITLSVSENDFVKKTEFVLLQEKVRTHGRVLIGTAWTSLEANDTLFVVDGGTAELPLEGVAYSNMIFSSVPPAQGQNWAQTAPQTRMAAVAETVTAAVTGNIVEGKLSVSEEAPPGTDYFAKIP